MNFPSGHLNKNKRYGKRSTLLLNGWLKHRTIDMASALGVDDIALHRRIQLSDIGLGLSD